MRKACFSVRIGDQMLEDLDSIAEALQLSRGRAVELVLKSFGQLERSEQHRLLRAAARSRGLSI